MSRQAVREQLAALGVTLLVIPWFLVWGPPHAASEWREHLGWILTLMAGVWIVCQIAIIVRRIARRSPGARTKLGTFTMWAGIASCAVLFTSFLLGWAAVFLAPAGILTGLIVLVREIRAQSGNDVRNLAGLALCAGAIAFLLA